MPRMSDKMRISALLSDEPTSHPRGQPDGPRPRQRQNTDRASHPSLAHQAHGYGGSVSNRAVEHGDSSFISQYHHAHTYQGSSNPDHIQNHPTALRPSKPSAPHPNRHAPQHSRGYSQSQQHHLQHQQYPTPGAQSGGHEPGVYVPQLVGQPSGQPVGLPPSHPAVGPSPAPLPPPHSSSSAVGQQLGGAGFFCLYCSACFADENGLRGHVIASHRGGAGGSSHVGPPSSLQGHGQATALRPSVYPNRPTPQHHHRGGPGSSSGRVGEGSVARPSPDMSGGTRQRYECGQCAGVFETRADLKKHISRHHDDKNRPFKCDICGSSFLLKTHLDAHVSSVHDKLRPFVCDICGMAFGLKWNMYDRENHQGIAHKVCCVHC